MPRTSFRPTRLHRVSLISKFCAATSPTNHDCICRLDLHNYIARQFIILRAGCLLCRRVVAPANSLLLLTVYFPRCNALRIFWRRWILGVLLWTMAFVVLVSSSDRRVFILTVHLTSVQKCLSTCEARSDGLITNSKEREAWPYPPLSVL